MYKKQPEQPGPITPPSKKDLAESAPLPNMRLKRRPFHVRKCMGWLVAGGSARRLFTPPRLLHPTFHTSLRRSTSCEVNSRPPGTSDSAEPMQDVFANISRLKEIHRKRGGECDRASPGVRRKLVDFDTPPNYWVPTYELRSRDVPMGFSMSYAHAASKRRRSQRERTRLEIAIRMAGVHAPDYMQMGGAGTHDSNIHRVTTVTRTRLRAAGGAS